MYTKQINRAFIGLLVCLAISVGAIAAPPNSSSKEVQKYCQAMGNVAGDAAFRTQKGDKAEAIWADYKAMIQPMPSNAALQAAVLSAIKFGVYMAPHYQPSEIARFQYYGCLATV